MDKLSEPITIHSCDDGMPGLRTGKMTLGQQQTIKDMLLEIIGDYIPEDKQLYEYVSKLRQKVIDL